MNPGGFKADDVYGVENDYIDYTIFGKSSGFEGVDVYGVNGVYTEYINQ